MGEYVVCITAAAILLAILNRISGEEGSGSTLLRLAGGIFLTIIITQPLFGVDLSEIGRNAKEFYISGTRASDAGVSLAGGALSESISSQLETYIRDKAAAYNSDLRTEVTLDENFQPIYIRIKGNISPFAKTQLQNTIEADLGIAKENQLWISPP